jgi:hypothetical protein
MVSYSDLLSLPIRRDFSRKEEFDLMYGYVNGFLQRWWASDPFMQ